MSVEENKAELPEQGTASRRVRVQGRAGRGFGGHAWRVAAWVAGGLLALVIVLVGAFAWYSTTADFQRRVGNELVSVLGDATGGRVEVGGVHFSLWHLAFEVDGLMIHGLEGPGEAPYLAADKVQLRFKIISFFAHTTGTGIASHVGLNLLRVEHPQIHLIIDKNGKTNQPVPKHPSTSTEPLQDTLLDLRANEVDLVNGVALLNDRAIPFDMAARDLNAQVNYLRLTDRYGIKIDLNDLRTKMDKQPEAQSQLHVEAELGRDVAQLTRLEFDTGKASVLKVNGLLEHFAQPVWQVTALGNLELKQISVLADVEGFTGGTVDLDVHGHSCAVSPAVAQTRRHFWERKVPAKPERPGTVPLSPDPECTAGYLVAGSAKVHDAGFETEAVRLHDVNGGGELHITPRELLLTALTGYLPGGGSAAGELRIVDWLGETAPSAPAQSPTVKGAVTTANKTAVAVGAKPTATTAMPSVYAHAYLVATV
ncbi:MAG TPA: translocation/assembly module TamB, partial [Acidobacteriaceae bacterium]|nr:translocation/assembly module TamB [Acidobacteriaceae bacterium]